MPRSAPPLPRELLRCIFQQQLDDETGPDWAEFNGKRFSLVCRDWAAPGQELTFYRPVLNYRFSFRGYRPEDPLQQFPKHLLRFPHVAHLVRDLRLEYISKEAGTTDALRTILQRCDRITEIWWPNKLNLLTTELNSLPLAELTVLQIGKYQRWDFSVLLGALPLCVKLSPSASPFLAILPPPLPHQQLNPSLSGRCTSNVLIGENLPLTTDFVVELTSLVLHLDDLKTLRFTQEKQTKADMWEAENDRCRTGLEELAARLSHFLDTLPPTLVELEAAFWAPAGKCYDLVKTFLRSRIHDSPLRRVIFDAEVKKFGRVRIKATKLHEWTEQGTESKTDWNLTYKHWAGCSCGDWDYGSWTLDGPEAAEYEVSEPSVGLDG